MNFSIVLVEKGSRGGKWHSRLKYTLMHTDVKNLKVTLRVTITWSVVLLSSTQHHFSVPGNQVLVI